MTAASIAATTVRSLFADCALCQRTQRFDSIDAAKDNGWFDDIHEGELLWMCPDHAAQVVVTDGDHQTQVVDAPRLAQAIGTTMYLVTELAQVNGTLLTPAGDLSEAIPGRGHGSTAISLSLECAGDCGRRLLTATPTLMDDLAAREQWAPVESDWMCPDCRSTCGVLHVNGTTLATTDVAAALGIDSDAVRAHGLRDAMRMRQD